MHPSATACPNKSQPYIPTPSPEIRSSKRHPHCPKNPATSRGISVTAASKTLDARQAADPVAPQPGPNGGGRIKAFSSNLTRRLPSSSTATASTPASRRTQPAAPGPQPGNRREPPAPTSRLATARAATRLHYISPLRARPVAARPRSRLGSERALPALCCVVRAARGKREKDGPVPEGGEAEGGGAHQGE